LRKLLKFLRFTKTASAAGPPVSTDTKAQVRSPTECAARMSPWARSFFEPLDHGRHRQSNAPGGGRNDLYIFAASGADAGGS